MQIAKPVVLSVIALFSVLWIKVPDTTAATETRVDVRTGGAVNGIITVEIKKPQLRCDGRDSSLVIITRQHSDGSLYANELQYMPGILNGTFEVLNSTLETDNPALPKYRYDENGQLRLRVWPTPGQSSGMNAGYWNLWLPFWTGDRIGHHIFPCPFSDDQTHTISGVVWNDVNADGQHDASERHLPSIGLKIQCASCFYYYGVPWHYERTDSLGQYEWVGLPSAGYGGWELCLDENYLRGFSIVSLNGSPIEPAACIQFPTVDPAIQVFVLGVARR